MFDAVIRFPKMNVAVSTRDGRVSEIRYVPSSMPEKAPTTALAKRAAQQLERYRDNPDIHFDLPLLIEGTQFQRRLWDALCEIPRG
jgi:methylated-DNA-[protein]-cysteine S-methyltransferase